MSPERGSAIVTVLRRAAAAVAVAAALAGAGCGGGEDGPTREEYTARAERICRTAAQQLRPAIAGLISAAGDLSALTAARERALVPRVRRIEDIGTTLLRRLRALEQPPGDGEAIGALLDRIAALDTAVGDAGDALAAARTTAALGALAEVGRRSEEARQAAADYGLTACAAAVSLPG